ncbi:MAG TPA: pilus assembly protein TadG-related protein, partial [Saliniramus sp.]|nr:pilus assembly protein TadG-related protein [Saliniramus sp.]
MRKTSFIRDQRGGVALMFGISMVAIAAVVGAAVDYSRAASLNSSLQVAADGAALAAIADPASTFAEREQIATRIAKANIQKLNVGRNIAVRVLELPDGGVRVEVEGDSASAILGAVGIGKTPVSVFAEAQAQLMNAEIALVLDNTGSMENDMDALRSGVAALIDKLLIERTAGNVRMSVVPYVAAVNPGRANLPMWMMDTEAASQNHGRLLRRRWTFMWREAFQRCINRGQFQDNTGGGSFKDRSDLLDTSKSLAGLVRELFGVTPASAQQGQVTPSTMAPYFGQTLDGGDDALLPDGFAAAENDCNLQNPNRVSNFDLFSRIPNAEWKGCVEARPAPHDVTDITPDRRWVNTLFTPYFWIDDTAAHIQGRPNSNDYLPDGPTPKGWTYTRASGAFHPWGSTYNMFKYDSVTEADIQEIPPHTLGPNKACPDEILPLTSNKDALQAKVAGLQHWHGGGTVTSEGLMWGWRTLSPGLPFDQGKPYGETRKIIVLFTDGKNMLVANGPGGPVSSDYSAYGHLVGGPFGVSTFADLETRLDERMKLACDNIKAAGIEIYSVMFREQSGTARDLVRNCASDAGRYFLATSQDELLASFENIAQSISMQRIA